MSNSGTYKKSRIETELKKFRENEDLKEILSMRIKIQHKSYYDDDYSPLFMPKEFNLKDDLKKSIKSWRKNLIDEVSKVDRFTTVAVDMANKVVTKVSKYRIVSKI